MAYWLVTLKDENGDRLYKCSSCGAVFKSEEIFKPEAIDDCPNCSELITGMAIDHSDKYTKEKVEEMFKIGEETQKLADECKDATPKNKDQSVPGIYERYMMDILDYLQAKFPQLGKDELMEAVGYISSRSMVMVQDTLIERDNMWHKEMNRMRNAYDREMRRGLKVSRRDVKKSDMKDGVKDA